MSTPPFNFAPHPLYQYFYCSFGVIGISCKIGCKLSFASISSGFSLQVPKLLMQFSGYPLLPIVGVLLLWPFSHF